MEFKVKMAEKGNNPRESWWEDYDHPSVKTQRDAFAYGKVLCEYWNSDLRPTELPRKVVNAQVIGPGKNLNRIPLPDPGQMDMLAPAGNRRMQ